MAQYRTEVQQTGCSQLTCQPTNLAALPSFAANLLLGFEILCGGGEALAQTDQKSCGSPSLELFKASLDVALSCLVEWKVHGRRLE